MNLELGKKLSNASGTSGFEKNISIILEENLGEVAQKVGYDNLGSIIFKKVGNEDGPKIMLAAHMDEVGFIIKDIDENGFLKFTPLGGWWGHVLLGQKVKVINKNNKEFTGVIGSKAPHVLPKHEREKVFEIKDMFIDLGTISKEEVLENDIRVGDMIVPMATAEEMLNDDFVLGKAWDDRIGCLIMIEVMQKLVTLKHENIVYAVGTVQEEIGLKGAKTSAQKIKPDIAFAIDTGIAGDTPGIKKDEAQAKLGLGPQVTYMDAGMIIHSGLKKYIEETATNENIPYQPEILLGGSTDAASIQLVESGIPTTAISLATRYIHSHNAIISKKDVDYAVDLIVNLIVNLDKKKYEDILKG